MEILCEAGASLNLNNEEQETALHVAAARGHIECMRCLLDSQEGQAVIDSQDRRGENTKETFIVATLSIVNLIVKLIVKVIVKVIVKTFFILKDQLRSISP